MRASQNGFSLVEGEIVSLAVAPYLIDFVVAGRRITVEKTAATSSLECGERVRMLLQEPFDDTHFHLIAFQKSDGEPIHFTGPSLTAHITFVGAALLAIGIYVGMASLLVSATGLFLLECLFSMQKAEALRLFRGR